MSEGASKISGPIPPDPSLFPECYRRPMSARGRLEGHSLKLDFLSGPLAPDPTLYPTCYSARPAPPPRVRPNATEILERGQRGTVGRLLQLQGVSLRLDPPPPKKEPRNHEKENVRRLREIQRLCREKEQEREGARPKPVKALWKSQKYEGVQSKVMAQLQQFQADNPPFDEGMSPPRKPECQNYLKAHSLCGSGVQPKRSPSPSPPKSRGDGSPTAEIQVKGTNIDFVSHNARNARQAAPRRSKSLQSLSEVLEHKRREQQEYDSNQKGRVPQYLQERRAEWQQQEEERRRNQPDPAMPPGHTRMPESERQGTLNSLKTTQQDLVRQLLRLPVRADTLSVQTRRAELDSKLSEVEEAIKIFSRPKVFVKVDS
ncbi:hypothetical protein AOXY_G28835 [Acipenser oxyrinchus oxyrinchus]|uniref:Enkurin domain-containing protein n=1 Tax=Acipenser oxyrinchus oxyrinchus TaxID=40147 RepID=A0AAD8CP27_ACIOX|nr:hypothetical protein AOXY_G28835 [Acipenser oxyrinchus oxyrinchus]